tara:strand:- start:35 stop:412 length:378 start_codon:yes stop_codon:yes gene_type:complete
MEKIKEYFKAFAENINENKYCIGSAMIFLNIGARFIIDELDDDLRSIVSNQYIRRFFIFCSFFMATRDIFTSIVLTIVFIIIINEFLSNDEEEEEISNEGKNSNSFNKKELEKTIQQLKVIRTSI